MQILNYDVPKMKKGDKELTLVFKARKSNPKIQERYEINVTDNTFESSTLLTQAITALIMNLPMTCDLVHNLRVVSQRLRVAAYMQSKENYWYCSQNNDETRSRAILQFEELFDSVVLVVSFNRSSIQSYK